MIGKPLKLNWNQLMPENDATAPPLELELVSNSSHASFSTPVSEPSSLSVEQQLNDDQLEMKFLRLTRLAESNLPNNLPDHGLKLRASVCAIQEEIERRKLARIHEAAEKCETATEVRSREPSVLPSNSFNLTTVSECDSQSLFAFRFNQILDEKAGSLSIRKHERTNSHRSPSRISPRRPRFPPYRKAASVSRKRSPNTNSNCIKASNFYGQCTGRSPTRLKLSKEKDNLIQRTSSVKAVVLLDEEDIQSDDLIRCDSDNRKEGMMYYPSRDHPESVELFYSDLKCLEPEQYISSPIMNFYIRYLQSSPSSVNKLKGEYFFFNTYFFGKLENALLSEDDEYLKFSKLRRWWKGVNIFEKAYIFLPIHKDLHWSLAIISIPSKEGELSPIILHLDSLGMHTSSQIFKVIKCFLTKEWDHTAQNSPSPHTRSMDKINVGNKVIKAPQQENVYDCGLFVLYFMERFMNEAPRRLKPTDLSMFGSKWFRAEDASGLRSRIKKLLLEEFESSMLENGREGCPESPGNSI